MRIIQKISVFIVFFIILINCLPINYNVKASGYDSFSINIKIDGNNYFLSDENYKISNLTLLQEKNINLSCSDKIILVKKLMSFGVDNENIIKYVYPNLYYKISEILKNEEVSPENAKIESVKNTAKIQIINSKNGLKVNKNNLFTQIINKITDKNIENIEIKKQVSKPLIEEIDLTLISRLRGGFHTSFNNSNEERKNNIKLALISLDGVVVNPNEIFSFNDVVGVRTIEKGYKQAKIISKGEFIDAVGGGVCQVSTTLYNAALLSGLEIIEVNSHSLKIRYVEPGFDAMVNSGSSDLKFKNNTGYPIIIATSYKNDMCNISIYGIENKYQYLRKYKTEEYETEINGDDILISKGLVAYATIVTCENGQQIDEKQIRMVKYKPYVKKSEM